MSCLFCGGAVTPWMSSPVDPKSGKKTPYGSMMICASCDVASVYPRPSPGEVVNFYKLDRYYTHGRSHFEQVSATARDRVLTKLAWMLDRGQKVTIDLMLSKFDRPGSVCDIGCGSGQWLTKFIEHGWCATGVEPDPDSTDQLYDRGLDVHAGTAEALPAAIVGRQFDLVIMSHVLEHCLDPAAALDGAVRLLKPGALLLVEVPNKDCIHFKTFGVGSECYDAPRHLSFFGPAGLKGIVEQHGLRVEEEYQHGLTRHHLPSWRATERRIRDLIEGAGGEQIPPAHTWLRSFLLLVQESLSEARVRYDAIGLWARKQ